MINCHGVNEGEELFQEKCLNSQAKYCWLLNYLDWARSKGGSVDVKKNRRWLLFVKIYSALSDYVVLVDTLVGSIVRDTRRKKCFQCQGGRKATGEWRDLLLCRYAMHEWVHADARQLRLRSHLKKDTFVVQKHYFVVYIFIQIKYYYTELRNWWRQSARVGWLATPQICQHDYIKGLCLNGFPIGNVWQNFWMP